MKRVVKLLTAPLAGVVIAAGAFGPAVAQGTVQHHPGAHAVSALTMIPNVESGTASGIAAQNQRNTCSDFWHYCQNPLDTYPTCYSTGVNVSGEAQWACYGTQERYYWPTYSDEIWEEVTDVGPYGGITYWRHWKIS